MVFAGLMVAPEDTQAQGRALGLLSHQACLGQKEQMCCGNVAPRDGLGREQDGHCPWGGSPGAPALAWASHMRAIHVILHLAQALLPETLCLAP